MAHQIDQNIHACVRNQARSLLITLARDIDKTVDTFRDRAAIDAFVVWPIGKRRHMEPRSIVQGKYTAQQVTYRMISKVSGEVAYPNGITDLSPSHARHAATRA